MSKTCTIATAALLFLVISVAFISPLLAVEPTALRAARMAATVMVAIAAAGLCFAAPLNAASPVARPLALFRPLSIDLIDLDCVRLC